MSVSQADSGSLNRYGDVRLGHDVLGHAFIAQLSADLNANGIG